MEHRVVDLGLSRPALILCAVAIAFGLGRRAYFGWEVPLWFDETYTGAIAIQPDPLILIEDLLSEVGGPAYYTTLWIWEKLFGAENRSLRAFSFACSVATPLLILYAGHPRRTVRWLWAAIASLWIPSFYYATEARSYTFILLVGSAQVILFLRLMSAPTLRRAAAWSALSTLLVLSHYHSLLVTGFQGLAYLIIYRERALRTWPAALFFVPLAAWMAFHIPLVLKLLSPQGSWQTLLTFEDFREFPDLLLGWPILAKTAFAIIGMTLLWDLWRSRRDAAAWPYSKGESAIVIASLLSILIVLGLGFIRPSYVFRYSFPYIPGFLFGIAVWAAAWQKRWKELPVLVVGAMLAFALWDTKAQPTRLDPRHGWNWEIASRDLMVAGARRLIVFVDSRSSDLTPPALLSRAGSFFFTRRGQNIPTLPVVIKKGSDPNRVLLGIADQPGDAVLWLFGRNQPNVYAFTYPPSLDKLDPTFTCRDYGIEPGVVITCLRGTGKAWPDSRPTDLAPWKKMRE
jgi:hypothetical protein